MAKTPDKPPAKAKPKKNVRHRAPRSPRQSSTGTVRGVKADQSNWRRKLKKSRIKFDDKQKDVYLQSLATTGLKGVSARVAGVCETTVGRHLETDPEFAHAYQEALRLYRDSIAETVRQRGQDGWLEPVYSKGIRVLEAVLNEDGTVKMQEDGETPVLVPASVRKFSDRLLELEAKRADPSYRDRFGIDAEGMGGGMVKKLVVEFVDPAKEDGDGSDSTG